MKRKLLACLILLGILMTGCSADVDVADLVGIYNCESINGNPPQESVETYLQIIDETTYTLVYNGNGYSFDFPGEYRVKGNKIYLSGFYDGKGNAAEQEGKIDGNKISYSELQTEYKYVFVKE